MPQGFWPSLKEKPQWNSGFMVSYAKPNQTVKKLPNTVCSFCFLSLVMGSFLYVLLCFPMSFPVLIWATEKIGKNGNNKTYPFYSIGKFTKFNQKHRKTSCFRFSYAKPRTTTKKAKETLFVSGFSLFLISFAMLSYNFCQCSYGQMLQIKAARRPAGGPRKRFPRTEKMAAPRLWLCTLHPGR